MPPDVQAAFAHLFQIISHASATSNTEIATLSVNEDWFLHYNTILNFFGNSHLSTLYRRFYDATSINLYALYNNHRHITFIPSRSINALQTFLSSLHGITDLNPQPSNLARTSRNRRRPAYLDEYTQQQNRGRRRVTVPPQLPPMQQPPQLPPLQPPPQLQPMHTLSIDDTLRMILESQPVPYSSPTQIPEMKLLVKAFVEKCNTFDLIYCNNCKERWFRDTNPTVCPTCTKHRNNFTTYNDMDPLCPTLTEQLGERNQVMAKQEYNYLIQNYRLTNIEESLIAMSQVFIQGFRLKGGSHGFKGNVISFLQDISSICSTLPRLPSSLHNFVVRCKAAPDNDDVTQFIDFKVRREHVRKWLVFLKRWCPPYNNITISDDNLQSLPENGSVYNHLNQSESDDDDIDEFWEESINDGNIDQNVQYSGFEGHRIQRSEHDTIDALIMQWPRRNETPNDEYNTSYLYTMAFPTLFPFGSGDIHYKLDRLHKISVNDANCHYLKYYDIDNKRYPFAEHPRFLHFAQDLDERNRIQSQASIFIRNNSELANMSVAEFNQYRNGDMWRGMIQQMHRYSANINGSPSKFNFHKKELLALIDRKGSPTFWFTLTLPLWLWSDVQRLVKMYYNR